MVVLFFGARQKAGFQFWLDLILEQGELTGIIKLKLD